MKSKSILLSILILAACSADNGSLPRQSAAPGLANAFDAYMDAVAEQSQNVQSIMIVKNGKVVCEKWMNGGEAGVPHIMNSVSKTFTSIAAGMAIDEGLMSLDDKIVDYFPQFADEAVGEDMKKVTVRNLLTMNSGHEPDPTSAIRSSEGDWVETFLHTPLAFEPGSYFCYNSLGTYVVSEIVQKVTGQKVNDYLETRLWIPLKIEKPRWDESPSGANCGGWGLYLKTEDMAKVGLLILQNGRWGKKQLVSKEWIGAMTSNQVPSRPAMVTPEMAERFGLNKTNSDWMQGYGYQMWQCRNNAFRADGANGQYILVLPEKDAVIAMTAELQDMQGELNLIWKHILEAL